MHTKNLFRSFALMLPLMAFSCENDTNLAFTALDDIDSKTYYSEEVILGENADIYGIWKLEKVTGGFSGTGHEIPFDFIQFKKVGIYGVIDDSKVVSWGKIDITPFDPQDSRTQFSFITADNESTVINGHYFPVLNNDGTLDLQSPCCDLYNFHFTRVR